MTTDPSRLRPLCFVAMPFGEKTVDGAGVVDFDAVYRSVIAPAIDAAGMTPLRADEERVGGIIHKPMFERLVLSEYVVADLTSANPNVFYELGVRHTAKPFTTITIAAEGTKLPFDLGPVRTFFYPLAGGAPTDVSATVATITELLRGSKDDAKDSPVFQLLEGFGEPSIERLRTDAFRDRVLASAEVRRRLDAAVAADKPAAALANVRQDLGVIEDVEIGIAIDLLLAYRDVSDWAAMDKLVADLPPVAQRTALVREQHALALNRLGRGDEAVVILEALSDERGQSSETLGILGRVHKDRWKSAHAEGRTAAADGHLRRAIDAYLSGFESDWRDAYPGINAVTLMALADPPDERRHAIAPVVMYSAQRRIASGSADYWDHATVLEAAVHADDEAVGRRALGDAIATDPKGWQLESTVANLTEIITAGATGAPAWWRDIADELAAEGAHRS